MYKVFFKDRTVFFSNDFAETFRTQSGLFYKYDSNENLEEIINAFFHLEKISSLYLFHSNLDFLRKEFSEFFKPIKAAGGLIRNEKGEFLAIHRNGIWDLPKGKAEKGESSEKTAVREVCEECGIEPPEVKGLLAKTWHAYMIGKKAVLKETDWYEMKVPLSIKTSPQKAENITEVRWFAPGKTEELEKNTFPLILEVLAKAKIL